MLQQYLVTKVLKSRMDNPPSSKAKLYTINHLGVIHCREPLRLSLDKIVGTEEKDLAHLCNESTRHHTTADQKPEATPSCSARYPEATGLSYC